MSNITIESSISTKLMMNLLALIIGLIVACNTHAATYYVDAKNGLDNLSGTTAVISGSNGPWKTLSRVSAATLLPGDTVLLACNQLWRETLKINQSGTASSPINIGAYGTQCTNPPRISGWKSLPAQAWQQHSATVWKLKFPLETANAPNSLSWKNATTTGLTVSQLSSCAPYSVQSCYKVVSANNAASINSPTFNLTAGKSYTLKFAIVAPTASATTAPVIVAIKTQGSTGNSTNLPSLPIVRRSMIQSINLSFTPLKSAQNVVLNIQLPTGNDYRITDISLNGNNTAANTPVTAENEDINQVFISNTPMTPAHHPNAGYDPLKPKSLYFKAAANNDKSTVVKSSDFFTPGGQSLVGLPISVRVQNWQLNHRTVSAVSGNNITVTPSLTFPLSEAGYGYYFTGALWMVDSPNEWYFDKASQTLYLTTTDGLPPDNRITIDTNILGIDVAGKSYINISGLMVDNVNNALEASKSNFVKLNALSVNHINGRGLVAKQANSLRLTNSQFYRIGREAVDLYASQNGYLGGNNFDQIGVFLNASGQIVSLPQDNTGAISGGLASTIENNRLSNFNYVGINASEGDLIQNNAVTNGCLVLNDCGAIYLANGTTAKNNVVKTMVGNVDGGVPVTNNSHAVGLYVDDGANNATVTGNTVSDVNFGIQLHNAYSNTVSNNLVYGARNQQMWLQEDQGATSLPTVDRRIRDNIITGNQFFPTTANGYIKLTTSISSTTDDLKRFASEFDRNIYSTYYGQYISAEGTSKLINPFTLRQWQGTQNQNGLARDANATVAAPQGNFALGQLGANIVPNSKFDSGLASWSRFGSQGLTISAEGNCGHPVPNTSCAKLAATTGTGNLSSPSFAVTKDIYYQLSFDAKTSDSTQKVTALVRLAQSPFTPLMTPYTETGSTIWKRYSLIFKATATANGSTGSPLARVDFTDLAANKNFTIANLEVTPFIPSVAIPLDSRIIVNTGRTNQEFSCPSANDRICNNYQKFPESTKVTFPVSLAPLESLVVYTQNLDYTDDDNDGIPNNQDTCSGTPALVSINPKGCSLEQSVLTR